jgi:putative Holliday junction resolvase
LPTDAKTDREVVSPSRPASGRLLALDPGTRRVGVAVSDEMRLTARPLPAIARASWKKLLAAVTQLVRDFDAAGVVLGLPLRLDGTEGDAAHEARRLARNFELSLGLPVYLQDERLTSRAAEESLRASGVSTKEIAVRVDSEAAVIILRDFMARVDGSIER